MQQSKQKPFKVSDKVYCLIYGEGVVTEVGKEHQNYMIISFEHNSKYYFKDGKVSKYANQTVFHKKPEVIIAFDAVFSKGEQVFVNANFSSYTEDWRFLTVEKEIEDRIYFKEYNNGYNYIQKKDIREIRPTGDKIEFN